MLAAKQKSGLYNTNTFARVTLNSIQEVIGANGLTAVLNIAGMRHLIGNFPPHNREKTFDFADYSALMRGIEEVYGPKGGRVLSLRAGRATFADLLATYGGLVGVSDLAFRLIPLSAKMTIGLNAMAKVFNMVSDQRTSVKDYGEVYAYVVHSCPACWGRQGVDEPVCYTQVGLIKQGLHWVSNGQEFRVKEMECMAMGAEACTFAVDKNPLPKE